MSLAGGTSEWTSCVNTEDFAPSVSSLTEKAAAELRDMIVRGALKPGERIVERKLCAGLDISRTPMREALKLLEHDGLVELSKNRGARVADYSAEDALQLFEVIGGLESIAAARFCANASPYCRAKLAELHEQMLSDYQNGDLDRYFDANSRIHDLIVDESGNAVLMESRRRLMLLAKRGRYAAIMDKARWRQAVDEHCVLIDAIDRHDIAAAGEIWRRHLMNTGASVAAAMRTADLKSQP